MNVYWFEQSLTDISTADDWLGERELAQLNALRFEKRRTDWRLGRWTAKRAVSRHLRLNEADLRRVEVIPSRTGAPIVLASGLPLRVSISISHRSGVAACAVSQDCCPLGCDLETVDPRCASFISDYFAANEQQAISTILEETRPLAVTLLWSMKESVLKALGVGLRMDPRHVIVYLDRLVPNLGDSNLGQLWQPVQSQVGSRRRFSGWWRIENGLVRTFAAEGFSRAPLPITHIPLHKNTSVSAS